MWGSHRIVNDKKFNQLRHVTSLVFESFYLEVAHAINIPLTFTSIQLIGHKQKLIKHSRNAQEYYKFLN